MDSDFRRVLAALAVVLALTGCNRNQQAPAPAPAQAPAPAAPAPAPQPPPPAPIPPATELPLNTVDSVMLTRPQDAPMAIIIQVSGSAPSVGWTGVRLIEDPENAPAPGIKTYKLVATSPAMPDENRTPEALQTELRVDALPADVMTIRVVSATNEISAPIAQ
jgi:2-oxoglutarate dehydrogenase E2 component (dihydrolipoamide succinyltransferase)